MRAKTFAVLLVGLVGASAHGCGGGSGLGGWAGSAAGSTGSAVAGTGGPAGTTGGAGTTGAAGISGDAGTGAAGTAPLGPLSGAKVEPTQGCGRDPMQPLRTSVRKTIQTTGTKAADCADSQCGAWSYTREYFVRLPAAYDRNKPYPLILEGPGCGGRGIDLYNNPALDALAIRVGLSPSVDAQAFHATNPNRGCFDDREGDDSVDWVFYEALYERLAAEVCFDRNRVFAAGNSSGSLMANQLACKYAGDALRPIRGVLSNQSGLPTDAMYWPTCATHPMAGFWTHETNNRTTLFAETTLALERAMRVNGCATGPSYETADYVPFPVGADTRTCKRVQGCPGEFPLVICPLSLNDKGANAYIVNPGWVAFLALFE